MKKGHHLFLMLIIFICIFTQNTAALEKFPDQPLYLAQPEDTPRGLIIFYPGGRVEPEAYFWAAEALAGHGYLMAVVDMPFNLAVLAPNRATRVQRVLEEAGYSYCGPVIIGGHSLGGAFAASYAGFHDVAGLFLWAAYPPWWTNLTGAQIPVLVLKGDQDRVASSEDIRQGLEQLPPHTQLVTIEGGNHAGFGRYGPQSGDGEALISQEQQEAFILQAMLEFLQDVEAYYSSH